MSYTPPPPPPPGSEGYGYATPRTNQKAQWSMILGILSIVCCGLLAGIPALVLGNSARKEIEASRGAQAGAGMAQAGVILGWISIAISLLMLILLGTGAITFDPGNPGTL